MEVELDHYFYRLKRVRAEVRTLCTVSLHFLIEKDWKTEASSNLINTILLQNTILCIAFDQQ